MFNNNDPTSPLHAKPPDKDTVVPDIVNDYLDSNADDSKEENKKEYSSKGLTPILCYST